MTSQMFAEGVSSRAQGATKAASDLWMEHVVGLNMDSEVLSCFADMEAV